MHTSRVLLNWSLALGAWLGVDLDPIVGITLPIIDSVLPLLQKVTSNGHVSLLSASKAEGMSTSTIDVNCIALFLLDNVVAVLAWTPLRLLGNIDK